MVLQTGGGVSLQTKPEMFSLSGLTAPVVLFDFGFATDEVPGPGSFLDSFTVSFQGGSTSQTAVLLTADASGVLWAPPSPGAISLTEGQIQRQAITPPSLQPIAGRGLGFSVRFPLPQELLGPTLLVNFDLFDNLNATASLGWYNDVRVESVPEPQSGLLAALGAMALAWKRRRRK